MTKRCWVVSDGSAGMINQAWGLAETLGYEVELKKIKLRRPWADIAQFLGITMDVNHCLHKDSDSLSPPYPDLVIASGRRSVLPALNLKKKSNGQFKVIYLQDPKVSPLCFDAVICPEHDGLIGPNVIQTLGATHRVTAERLAKAKTGFQHLNPHNQPVLSVIIGGSTKKARMNDSLADKLIPDLNKLSQQGWRVLVTLSRRTPLNIARKFKAISSSIYVWDGTGANPYFGLLSLADAILVTCDSVSMISEACATNASVYLYKLPAVYWKHQQFHQSLININRISWWHGTIVPQSVTPLMVNEKAARQLKTLLNL